MPRKTALKCYFGCVPYKGKIHHFPPPEYPYSEKFDQWKVVLSEIDKVKGDKYIYNNIRICDHHFEDFYKTVSGRLSKNAVPTLNIASTSTSSSALKSFEIQFSPYSVEQNKPADNVETTSGEVKYNIMFYSSLTFLIAAITTNNKKFRTSQVQDGLAHKGFRTIIQDMTLGFLLIRMDSRSLLKSMRYIL